MRVIHVLRKPCAREAGTVAANVLRWGTGALNIDASRIRLAGDEVVTLPQSDPSKRAGEVGRDLGFTGNDVCAFKQAQRESIERTNTLGRWPANLVLQHLYGCRCEGTREVPTDGHFPATRPAGSKVSGASGHVGQQGLEERSPKRETVANWTCEPGCPVMALDAQSGVLPARGNVNPSTIGGSTGASFRMPRSESYHHTRPELNAPGGASRFFRQFHGKARE